MTCPTVIRISHGNTKYFKENEPVAPSNNKRFVGETFCVAEANATMLTSLFNSSN